MTPVSELQAYQTCWACGREWPANERYFKIELSQYEPAFTTIFGVRTRTWGRGTELAVTLCGDCSLLVHKLLDGIRAQRFADVATKRE